MFWLQVLSDKLFYILVKYFQLHAFEFSSHLSIFFGVMIWMCLLSFPSPYSLKVTLVAWVLIYVSMIGYAACNGEDCGIDSTLASKQRNWISDCVLVILRGVFYVFLNIHWKIVSLIFFNSFFDLFPFYLARSNFNHVEQQCNFSYNVIR